MLFSMAFAMAMPVQTRFVVGTEDLAFYPHYDFTTGGKNGFANDVLNKFAEQYGYQFSFQPLPVKRLYHELDNTVDFIYPDNPAWHSFQGDLADRLYSEALVYNLGVSMVKPQRQQLTIKQVRTLAIIRGFTPVQWLRLKQSNRFEIFEVANPQSAVSLVLRGELDVADLEYNVALHLLTELQQPEGLVVAENLPFSQVGFHLSTTRHSEVLAQFNRFLVDNQLLLQELKLHYGLLEQLPQQQLEYIE
ncbi:substrate-binding periplasmic protein [Arsukibacterium indicum]|uniref:Transporter substrate-binding domain-containing protein n=1 Tax=Arsukibacterium indicum TaxID=2848612 RepID=A0ABS6MII5_9GAMM|nr:transporter substrate-binding domain-containing protein [Arsukibacterium indicum]MBV2128616.1 transporter substrate-binding domain-containing protein [Arsukibacterium indicum]